MSISIKRQQYTRFFADNRVNTMGIATIEPPQSALIVHRTIHNSLNTEHSLIGFRFESRTKYTKHLTLTYVKLRCSVRLGQVKRIITEKLEKYVNSLRHDAT